jgi:hypothetical protein
MPARQTTDTPLAPELEAIATTAADHLGGEADTNTDNRERLRRAVAEAASAAIAGRRRTQRDRRCRTHRAKHAPATSWVPTRSNESRAPRDADAKPTANTRLADHSYR